MPAPSPPPDDNDRAFSPAELAVARRAYARQMTASLGVDNPAIEAAYAAAPLEAFLGPPPWTASSPFTGYRPLSGSDPVGLYQDHSHRPRPGARGQQPARRCAPSSSRPSARSPASASMSAPARAIIARSGRAGRPGRPSHHGGRVRRRAGRAGWRSFFSGRTNVRVVSATTALTGPKPRPDGVYVNFAVSSGRRIAGSRTSHPRRPADVPARRPGTRSGRIPAAGTATAARRWQWARRRLSGERAVSTAYVEDSGGLIPTIWRGCAPHSRPAASTQSAA